MAKHQFTDAERFTVFSADGGKCFWCGLPLYYRDVQIDHCIPESVEADQAKLDQIRQSYGLGADFKVNGFENWVTCHQGCNLRKTDSILPNAPATLFVFSLLIQRGPKLEEFRKKFNADTKRERVLATLRSALKKQAIEKDDVLALIEGLPALPLAGAAAGNSTIHLSESWSIVFPGSPAAFAKAHGWKIGHVSGNIAYVHDGRVGGIVPNVADPHPTWVCSQCGQCGPWDGIICRNCGNREEPD